MRCAVLVVSCVASFGCTQAPSVLRATDLSQVTTISLVSTSGSSTAADALAEELKNELPSGNRFALVPAGANADATLAIEAQRWWIDQREMAPAASLTFPPRVRRVETMEATFKLAFGPNEVSETYRRSSSAAPRGYEATVWNDDLVAANAVQIVAAFVGDLSFDAQGGSKPSRPAPTEAPAPVEAPAPEEVPSPL